MIRFLRAHWPSLAHVAAIAILFLDPSVQSAITAHPAYAAPIAVVWGVALHWATSPRDASKGSKF